ncbi:hypothetical protein JOE11_003689 [Robbsia andropogonis]
MPWVDAYNDKREDVVAPDVDSGIIQGPCVGCENYPAFVAELDDVVRAATLSLEMTLQTLEFLRAMRENAYISR